MPSVAFWCQNTQTIAAAVATKKHKFSLRSIINIPNHLYFGGLLSQKLLWLLPTTLLQQHDHYTRREQCSSNIETSSPLCCLSKHWLCTLRGKKTSSTCGYNNVQLASYFTLSYSNQSPENTEKKLSLTKQYAVVTRKTRHTIAKRSFLVYHNSTIHTEDKTPSLLLLSIARAEKREHHVGV